MSVSKPWTLARVKSECPEFVAWIANAEFHINGYGPGGTTCVRVDVKPYGGDEKSFYVAWEQILRALTAPVSKVMLVSPQECLCNAVMPGLCAIQLREQRKASA